MQNETLAALLSAGDQSREAWNYSSGGEEADFPLEGDIAVYKGDGFSAELIVDRENAVDVVRELENNLWIDRQTRAIFLEYILYNGNSNLFAFITMWAEVPITNGFLPFAKGTMIRIYATGFHGIYMRVMEVLLVALLIGNLIISVYQVKIEGSIKACIKKPRVIVDVLLFSVSIMLLVFFALRYVTTKDLITKIRESVVHFIPFQRSIFYHELFMYFLAFVVALAMFKFVILLRLMERIAKLAATLRYSAFDVISTICIFAIGVCIFAMLGFLAFHHDTAAYRTYRHSLEMLIGFSLGEIKGMENLFEHATPFLQFYVITFVLFAQFVMLNILIAVIMESHEMFKYQSALQPKDHELVEEIFNQAKKGVQKALDKYTQLQGAG